MKDKSFKGKIDRFFLDEIKLIQIGNDGQDQDKLRLYKALINQNVTIPPTKGFGDLPSPNTMLYLAGKTG